MKNINRILSVSVLSIFAVIGASYAAAPTVADVAEPTADALASAKYVAGVVNKGIDNVQTALDAMDATIGTKASQTDLAAATSRLTAAEGKITANETAISKNADNVTALTKTVGDNDTAVRALITANDAEIEGLTTSKQDKVVAGTNITVADDGKTIGVNMAESITEGQMGVASADLVAKKIATIDSATGGLGSRMETAEGEIDTLQTQITGVTTNAAAIEANTTAIADKAAQADLTLAVNRIAVNEGNITSLTTSKQNALTGVSGSNGVTATLANDAITVTGTPASKTNAGVVKIGSGINVSETGEISVAEYAAATKTAAGIVQVGENINVNDGVISVTFPEAAVVDTELNSDSNNAIANSAVTDGLDLKVDNSGYATSGGESNTGDVGKVLVIGTGGYVMPGGVGPAGIADYAITTKKYAERSIQAINLDVPNECSNGTSKCVLTTTNGTDFSWEPIIRTVQ